MFLQNEKLKWFSCGLQSIMVASATNRAQCVRGHKNTVPAELSPGQKSLGPVWNQSCPRFHRRESSGYAETYLHLSKPRKLGLDLS